MEHTEQHDKTAPNGAPKPRRARLRLPFDDRRKDPVDQIYEHRVGVCVIVVALVALMVAFVWVRLSFEEESKGDTIYIDMVDEQLEQKQEERERLEQELKELQDDIDWRSVQNVASNENAEELKDDRGTDMRSLQADAEKIQQELNSSNEDYSASIKRIEQMKYEPKEQTGDEEKERKDHRVKGAVTASYSLINPVRHRVHLEIPAYRCERGGEVVVEITVNRAGEVIDARIKSGSDYQMQQVALAAARRSSFDINRTAPEKQKGTITYIFIPQ